MIKTIEDRKQKWMRFLNGGGDERTMYIIEAHGDGGAAPGPRPLPKPWLIKERIDWAYENYNMQMEKAEWLADDALPALSPYTGTEIFAEAFGCAVHYPDNDMPFALPKYAAAKDARSLKLPGVHDTPLTNIFEIARRLRQKAGSGAVMQLPDIQSPADIAALILNKEEFYVAMAEDPQLILDMIGKAERLLCEFLDEWFSEFGRSYIAHYPPYYMEGGVTLSEDEVGAFGRPMFDAYVLDTLNGLSEKYGGIGIHCCAHSEHQWDNFKKVKGLKLLNLNNRIDFIKRYVNYFSGFTAMWPIDNLQPSDKDPAWLADCPPGARVVLTYKSPSRSAAMETAKRAEELRRSRAAE